MVIDSHQHFWNYHPDTHAWIGDGMDILKRDFLPNDLLIELNTHHLDGSIAVQANQSEQDTLFLHELSTQHEFIKAVVGWVNLLGSDIESRLEYFSELPKIKGFRHVVQDELDSQFMSRPDFKNGISKLDSFGFTYDILIYPHQLQSAIDLVRAFPNQKFVIDHLAKPQIENKQIDEWKRLMLQFSELDNVWCKVSGMVTEASWTGWTKEDFIPYLNIILDVFGPDKIMFGSDWPVCLLAASYGEVKEIVSDYVDELSLSEQDCIFGKNTMLFYNLM